MSCVSNLERYLDSSAPGGERLRRAGLLLFIVAAALLLIGLRVEAASNRLVNDFLTPGLGGRAAGLGGGGYVAVADDASAILWNPAGLTRLSQKQWEGLFRRRFDDTFLDQAISLALPRSRDTLGLAYYQTLVNDIPVTQPLTEGELNLIQLGAATPPASQGTKSSRDSAVLVSWARPVSRSLSVGLTGKAVQRDFLGALQGYGLGLDVGALYRRGPVSIGVTAQDALQYMRWSGKIPGTGESYSYNERAAVGFRAGAAYNMAMSGSPNHRVTFLAGGEGSFSTVNPQMGAELQYQAVQVRGSVVYDLSKRSPDSGFKSATYQPALGIGLDLPSWDVQMAMRYHPLGWVQTFSLGRQWGGRDAR